MQWMYRPWRGVGAGRWLSEVCSAPLFFHIHVSWLELVVVGYFEGYCTLGDVPVQMNICLLSIAR